METIDNFTKKFLNYKTSTIFIFIILLSFKWHSSLNSISYYLTDIINLIGAIGIISWIYAIASKGNQILIRKEQNLTLFRKFKINLLLLILSYILLNILAFIPPSAIATESDFARGEAYNFKRIYYLLNLIFVINLFLTIRGVSKLLVSAEYGSEKPIQVYYKTLLLFMFSWIGIWFIHPRIQELK
jgi:hypothetical protein